MPAAGLAPGAWSIMGKSGSRGDLEALWGDIPELGMQGSWENLAALLGNPLPLPLELHPFEEANPHQTSSSSNTEQRHLVCFGLRSMYISVHRSAR